MKKLIGTLLILTPFIALTWAGYKDIGRMIFVVWGGAIIFVCLVATGIHLVDD